MLRRTFFVFMICVSEFHRQPNHLKSLTRKRMAELPQRMLNNNNSRHWKLTKEPYVEARLVGSPLASQTLAFYPWGHTFDTTTVEGGGSTRDSPPYPASLSWRTVQECWRKKERERGEMLELQKRTLGRNRLSH